MQSRLEQAYQSIGATFQYAANHPMRLLAAAFYFQAGFVNAVRTPNNYAGINQSPLQPQVNLLASGAPICYPVDELSKHYHIITNVPSLNDAEIILFGENHQNLNHHRYKSHFAKTITRKNDYLFFEGIPKKEKFPCESICTAMKVTAGESHIVLYRDFKMKNIYNINPQCHFYFNFSPKLQCIGWDDAQAHIAGGKLLDRATRSSAIATSDNIAKMSILFGKIRRAVSDIEVITTAKQIMQFILGLCENEYYDYCTQPMRDEIKQINNLVNLSSAWQTDPNKIFSFLTAQYQFFVSIRETVVKKNAINSREFEDAFDNILIKLRNKEGLIDTLESYRKSRKRKLVFAGTAHLFKTVVKSDADLHQTVKETDPEWELRKYLEQYPHAVLIPKL